MVYKKFSMLFTGDIEKIAEEKIIETYKNETNKLKATIIKIPHHGSKTASTMDLIFGSPRFSASTTHSSE